VLRLVLAASNPSALPMLLIDIVRHCFQNWPGSNVAIVFFAVYRRLCRHCFGESDLLVGLSKLGEGEFIHLAQTVVSEANS